MAASLLTKVRILFNAEATAYKCLQCGRPPGREFMLVADEPIIHAHQCSWCKGVLYVPGPMFRCTVCSENGISEPVA